ncbi:MAG: Maf family protein [Candidatus Omnitrophica bacterium]|nr:Maf family protein [Candidatus Omnitrophota bacterium]
MSANKYKIILASASQRRTEILTSCSIKHGVMISDIKEIQPKRKNIISSVTKNAMRKVRSITKKAIEKYGEDLVLIGADTLVTLGNEVIGKPKDALHAKELLKKFSDHHIQVYTGLFVFNTHKNIGSSGYSESSIKVSHIPDHLINMYFKRLGSYDKAGGFSIEGVGSILFDDIKGSYFNILGLPTNKLSELFLEIGLNLIDFCSGR